MPKAKRARQHSGGGGTGRLVGPGTDDQLAILLSYLGPDGTLRVPGLAVVDNEGRDLITLDAVHGRAEVTVRLPRVQGAGLTAVSLYALQGPADLAGIEPSVGIDISVDGSQAMVLEVVPDRCGGWTLTRSTPEPPPVV